MALLKKNDLDKAVADYKNLIRLEPHPVETYADWDPDKAEGQSKAVQRLEEGMAKSKPEADGHYAQGAARQKDGKLTEAIAEYDKAIAIYPRYPIVYYNRGLACRQKGDMEKAILDYSQAIELDPRLVNAYVNRGFAFYKLGDADSAVADFDKVLELEPKNVDAQKSRELILKSKTKGESQ